METAEIKDHGAKARDSLGLTEEEFISVIDESRKKVLPHDRDLHKFAHPAFLLTQFHLDGRLDDIALLVTNELRPYRKQKHIFCKRNFVQVKMYPCNKICNFIILKNYHL